MPVFQQLINHLLKKKQLGTLNICFRHYKSWITAGPPQLHNLGKNSDRIPSCIIFCYRSRALSLNIFSPGGHLHASCKVFKCLGPNCLIKCQFFRLHFYLQRNFCTWRQFFQYLRLAAAQYKRPDQFFELPPGNMIPKTLDGNSKPSIKAFQRSKKTWENEIKKIP